MKKRIKLFIKRLLYNPEERTLENNGERIEINLTKRINFKAFDIYQKSHYKRYEFAKEALNKNEICGDFACGTGYGSIMLGEKAKKVIAVDLDCNVIDKITHRYRTFKNVEFIVSDLLDLKFIDQFDSIISFETIEHFTESNIQNLFKIFSTALKKEGKIIFSTPYLQQKTPDAVEMGHHLTYNIDESIIAKWLTTAGFRITSIKYQNYISHLIDDDLKIKDFIICTAKKI
jgi:2-polyprenyl-3-methyl-5-hydroxy-6-metoxy-1,4-benzoquinol methylase